MVIFGDNRDYFYRVFKFVEYIFKEMIDILEMLVFFMGDSYVFLVEFLYFFEMYF